MAVEARFICENKTPMDQTSVQVRLGASILGRDNVEWAPYTPSGSINMVVNGPAGGEFVAGKRYRVLIEELPEDAPQAT